MFSTEQASKSSSNWLSKGNEPRQLASHECFKLISWIIMNKYNKIRRLLHEQSEAIIVECFRRCGSYRTGFFQGFLLCVTIIRVTSSSPPLKRSLLYSMIDGCGCIVYNCGICLRAIHIVDHPQTLACGFLFLGCSLVDLPSVRWWVLLFGGVCRHFWLGFTQGLITDQGTLDPGMVSSLVLPKNPVMISKSDVSN